MSMKRVVELYEKENKNCPVLEFILSLPPKHRAKVEREIDLLEEFGVNHTKKTFVLLHGIIKKTNKTPQKELETAQKYMVDYLRRCTDNGVE